MATHRRKIARSAVRRVKRRNTKLRTLRSRKNTTEKKARMNMRKMRGGGGNYDIYLVYFDDVAKFKDTTNTKWTQILKRYPGNLVGILFYNPTDKKFYFFGCELNSQELPLIDLGSRQLHNAYQRNLERQIVKDELYRGRIRTTLVSKLMPCKGDDTDMRNRIGENGVSVHLPDMKTTFIKYYLTYSNGNLTFTYKQIDREHIVATFVDIELRNCDSKLPISLPTTMLSDVKEEPTGNPTPDRAYLFYRLGDEVKSQFDPTVGLLKKHSKPLETADNCLNYLLTEYPTGILPLPPPSTTPILKTPLLYFL
jgi:hypothetical protein